MIRYNIAQSEIYLTFKFYQEVFESFGSKVWLWYATDKA